MSIRPHANVVFLLAALGLLGGCASEADGNDEGDTSGLNDRDKATRATKPTVEESYRDLFDAKASVAKENTIDGLWQLPSGPCSSKVRIQFQDGQMRVAVQWGEALFGLTTAYELDSLDPDEVTAVRLVFAEDAEENASDGGFLDPTQPATTFRLGVKSGPATADNAVRNRTQEPLSARLVKLGDLFEYDCSEYGSHGRGDGGGGSVRGSFSKIGD